MTHDMRLAGVIDVIDERRQRRTLAAPGGAGQQHETALLVSHPPQHRGEAEVQDRADLRRNDPEHHGNGAALLEDVATKTTEPGHAVGEIHLVLGYEPCLEGRRDQRAGQGLEGVRVQPAVLGTGK